MKIDTDPRSQGWEGLQEKGVHHHEAEHAAVDLPVDGEDGEVVVLQRGPPHGLGAVQGLPPDLAAGQDPPLRCNEGGRCILGNGHATPPRCIEGGSNPQEDGSTAVS